MAKKKTKTKNDPWAPAQPYILQGLQQSGAVQSAQQPLLDKFSKMQMDTYGKLAPGAEQGIASSQGLVNDTLAGKYLQGNPYLEGIIDKSNRGIADSVNGQFESSGRYGSGMHAGVLADKIAENENLQRFQNYGTERQNQINAVGQASGLMGGSQSLLNNAADLPWIGVSALNGNVRQASNGYGTTTTSTSDPIGQLTGLVGAGASLTSAIKSDERIKNVGEQVGMTPDGLPLYDYTYKDDPAATPQTGVMAQDVEKLRPDAMGPTDEQGVKSVDYGKLDLPDPTTLAETITPQKLPNAYGNKDNVDRSFGGILGRFANPDPNDKWGRIGLLGQRLMAGEGSPFQALGKGLIGAQDDARDLDDRKLQRDQQAQDAQLKQLLAIETMRKNRRPTYQNVEGVGLVAIPNEGDPSVAVPMQPKDPNTGPLAYLRAMGIAPDSPEGKTMLTRAMTGYNLSPEAQQQKIATAGAVAGVQGEQRAKYRAPAGKSGGSTITATARAKYMSEAEAAIAAGAPRDAVYARLAKMGVR